MAAFVVDASATLPWCFADEATAATNAPLARLRRGDEAIVPAHWPFEVTNALLIAVRRKRISPQDVPSATKGPQTGSPRQRQEVSRSRGSHWRSADPELKGCNSRVTS
jgi:hypothetical protein